jgi:branched-chain amino acid transport system ATP-binding protein
VDGDVTQVDDPVSESITDGSLEWPMLELTGITGGYGSTTVLRDVTFSVPSGSVVALLGPNGAGKSTTMRMVSGLLHPQQGCVMLEGKDVTRANASRRARLGICHVMEGRSIFPSLTVRENLRLQSPRHSSTSDILDRTEQEFPQIAKRRKQIAGTLSGGEQQMLALMRAYLSNPKVVLVDEASLGLAPLIVDQIFDFLQRIARNGVSLLIVEQYAERVLAIASTVYLLNQGRVVHSGPAQDLDEEQVFSLYAQ